MRPATSRRATSPLKTIVLGMLTLLIGAAATVGGLWAAGVDLPFLKSEPDYTGMVAVPITTRTIPAYTRVTRDYLLIPEKGIPKYMYLPPEMAKQLGVITNFSQITGRVLDHEKPPGYPFTEKDFLPKGTRPGLVAAIPAGKRAMTVEATKIQGIHRAPGRRPARPAVEPVDRHAEGAHQGRGGQRRRIVQVGLMAQQKTGERPGPGPERDAGCAGDDAGHPDLVEFARRRGR